MYSVTWTSALRERVRAMTIRSGLDSRRCAEVQKESRRTHVRGHDCGETARRASRAGWCESIPSRRIVPFTHARIRVARSGGDLRQEGELEENKGSDHTPRGHPLGGAG